VNGLQRCEWGKGGNRNEVVAIKLGYRSAKVHHPDGPFQPHSRTHSKKSC